jgi:peptidoglycan hydrolase-like protein with peptidoglycan-binding domain
MIKVAKYKLLVACSALLILAWLAAGCIPAAAQPVTNSLPPATAQVVQTTLVETRSVTGELGYGDVVPLRAAGAGNPTSGTPASGTLTWIAPAGSTVASGEPLFKVDEQAVVSLYGEVPMYRTLEEGAQGADVLQLEQNLAELGYTGYTYVNIDVLSNDRGTGLQVSSVTDPANGRAVINEDDTITYTPNPGFAGVDTFSYTAADANDLSDSSVVTVVVLPVSSPASPNGLAASPDVATTSQDQRVTVEVLDNDQGEDLQVNEVANPGHGTAVINGGNTITYTPASSFTGVDTFDYTVTDAGGRSASAQVTVVVIPAALPPPTSGPAANPDVATTNQDTPDGIFTTATAEAVRAWQADSGLPVTGIIEPGQVVFTPGAVRIAEHTARPGEALGGNPVLTYTGLDRIVAVPLRVADLALAAEGREVTVTLPDGESVVGVISQIGAVVNNGAVDVAVTIADQQELGSFSAAPVDVVFISQERPDVLAVPVSALLALAEGGYGVEIVEGDGTYIVPVSTGMFAGGQVEVSGEGLAEGVTVGVAR